MRPVEIAVVLLIATLAISWIGPLAWALVDRVWMYRF
jgi:hypothetical protein